MDFSVGDWVSWTEERAGERPKAHSGRVSELLAGGVPRLVISIHREGRSTVIEAAECVLSRRSDSAAPLPSPSPQQFKPAAKRASAGMSAVDRELLAHYEQVVGAGLETFYKVGAALAVIRNDRLYRETDRTFEDYCHRRWGIGHRYANRLIDSAGVIKELAEIGARGPQTERQTRELAKAPAGERAAVLEEARRVSGSDEPTSSAISVAVRRRKDAGPDCESPRNPPAAELTPDAGDLLRDQRRSEVESRLCQAVTLLRLEADRYAADGGSTPLLDLVLETER